MRRPKALCFSGRIGRLISSPRAVTGTFDTRMRRSNTHSPKNDVFRLRTGLRIVVQRGRTFIPDLDESDYLVTY
jgi:hypothetical protein